MNVKRTQAERRAATREAVLSSATSMFGSRGYSETSLEDIAGDCGVSIAPIYHYFGNKKKLFSAVNDAMEERILVPAHDAGANDDQVLTQWQTFLELCKDPAFRRIVLIDGPNILGLERMSQSRVTQWVQQRMRQRFNVDASDNYKGELVGRMMTGALAQAGLFIGSADDPDLAAQDADEIVAALVRLITE